MEVAFAKIYVKMMHLVTFHSIVWISFADLRKCVQECKTHKLLNKLNYTNMDIMVDLFKGKNPLGSLLVTT